jgi:hypothetical protein
MFIYGIVYSTGSKITKEKIMSVDNEDEGSFFLIYGGGTNSMSIHFRKYENLEEQNIEKKFNQNYYKEKYLHFLR